MHPSGSNEQPRPSGSFPRTPVAIALIVVLAALTSGCADNRRPPVAAMVPLTANGDYGYTERRLAPDLYAVTFISPRLRASTNADGAHGLVGEKQRVYDLALWRAAQLAQENRRPAFKVEQEDRDVDVTVRHDRVYPAYPPPFFFGRRCWNCGPYWPGYPYYYYDDYYDRYRTSASGRITVNLTVKMLPAMAEGAMETAATIDRLRKAYGSATFALSAQYY